MKRIGIIILLFITIIILCFLIINKRIRKIYNTEEDLEYEKVYNEEKNNKVEKFEINEINKTIFVYWDSGLKGMKPLIKSVYLNNKKVAEKI